MEPLKTLYDSAVKLVAHDDTLNWTKFYNMAYANLGLIGAYAFSLDKGSRPFLFLIAIFGIVVGVLFDLTLQEGMRCLRAHRLKVDLLDELFAINTHKKFLFCTNPYNKREALWWGPPACVAFWLAVFVVTFWVSAEPRLTRLVP